MDNCKFCAYKPIEVIKTHLYLCSKEVPAALPKYASVTTIPIQPTLNNYKHDTRFSPGARLSLSPEQAQEMLTHRQAWTQFLDTKAEHALICRSNHANKNIENVAPPKDWDVMMISDTDYVLTKRGAKLLLSTYQIHDPLPLYIQSHPLLKVIHME